MTEARFMDTAEKLRATATQYERLRACGDQYALSETRSLLNIIVRDITTELQRDYGDIDDMLGKGAIK